ncbi:hypothetical protein C8J57DRAFT_1731575 [Mycena rebaudengoi]|nr:hypothetical protein C8J57DRAFT_1731575 [Mycena rebaudengoi]
MLRLSTGSVSSLRPYTQSRGASTDPVMIGQPIAPRPTQRAADTSPPARPPVPSPTAFKRMHRRTMMPTPEPEPAPVFQPLRLRPSRIRPPVSVITTGAVQCDSKELSVQFRSISMSHYFLYTSPCIRIASEMPDLQNT